MSLIRSIAALVLLLGLWAGGHGLATGEEAIGEPPLCLAISVYSAICDAVRQSRPDGRWPKLNAPATAEAILMAID